MDTVDAWASFSVWASAARGPRDKVVNYTCRKAPSEDSCDCTDRFKPA